jgi:hypothetical protein
MASEGSQAAAQQTEHEQDFRLEAVAKRSGKA